MGCMVGQLPCIPFLFFMKNTVRAPRNIQRGGKWHKASGVVVWPDGTTNATVIKEAYLTYWANGRKWYLHVSVAQLFVPNPKKKPYVNHKDGNKRNAHKDNLEWVTASENCQHAISTGLKVYKPPHKFTPQQIAGIRRSTKPRYIIADKYGVSEKVIYNIQYFITHKNTKK